MRKFFMFVILPVLLASGGEFMLKHSINHQETSEVVLSWFDSVLRMLANPLIVMSLLMIVSGGVLWVVAMSKYELSFLYPFMSLNFLVIVVGSQFFLGESVSIYRYVAVVLIIVGLVIISRSPYSENTKE